MVSCAAARIPHSYRGETLEFRPAETGRRVHPGHASQPRRYFDPAEGVALSETPPEVAQSMTAICSSGHATPDIGFGAVGENLSGIQARKPKRLFLTHYGFAENPAAHIATFRERLRRMGGRDRRKSCERQFRGAQGPVAGDAAALEQFPRLRAIRTSQIPHVDEMEH